MQRASPDRPTRAIEALAAFALLAMFAAVAIESARIHSGVPDEIAVHLPSGFLYLETGQFAGALHTPPLGQVALALPAWLGAGDYTPFAARGLFAPRLVAVAIGVLAGIALFAHARALAGPAVALAALLFLATSPTFQAHSSVATVDVPVAAAMLAATLAARAVAVRATLASWLVLGIALGAACATKVQGIAVLGVAGLQIVLARVWLREGASSETGALQLADAVRGPLVALAALVLFVHAAYGFEGLASGQLLPPTFVDSVLTTVRHNSGGHSAYLLGELSNDGWWSYFPIAMLVKSPLVELACAAIGAALLARNRALVVWLGIPLATYAAMAIGSNINIGIRHLLPFHPFWFAIAGLGLVHVGARSRTAALALVAAQLVESLVAAPHGFAYFNAIAGGVRGGDRWLVDSNYDWGQHDGALRVYLDAHPGPVEIDPDPLVPRAGRILVGATALHGVLGPGEQAYRWLRDREPSAHVGITWREYVVREDEIARAPRRPPRLDPVRRALARHTLRASLHRAIASESPSDPRVKLALANACYVLIEYDCAVDTALAAVRAAPKHRGAFWLASEITARRRLGVLAFSGREYLDGFERLEPADDWLSPERLAELAPPGEPREALARLHRVLGDYGYDQRDYADALAHWERSLALEPDDFGMQYKVAWLLATTPRDEDRDGERAVELARVHGERASWKTAATHDLLAAALAAAGQHEAAVAAADEAIALAGDAATRAAIEARRERYARGASYLLEGEPEPKAPGTR